MQVSDFDFELPPELIAQEPAAERSAARLLHLDRESGSIVHTTVAALPERLRAGDLVVVNNTRVFPARLRGHRVPSGGAVECLLIRRLSWSPASNGSDPKALPVGASGSDPKAQLVGVSGSDPETWEALMHPGQKLKPGAQVTFTPQRGRHAGDSVEGVRTLHGEVQEQHYFGRRVIRLWTDDGSTVDEVVDAIGHVPLPPYIKRDDRQEDRDRYQTVFAHRRGSVAAPTAGLHFTPALVQALSDRGVQTAEITLHVGYGTFQPVRVDRVEDHRLEPEGYEIDPAAASAINTALAEGRRVLAVGTTTTRTLEAAAAANDGHIVAGAGTTDLFIYPGFAFKVAGALLTNFHLPRSSLIMLVAAFAGHDKVMTAYHAAIAERYRFYSYGDAMLVT